MKKQFYPAELRELLDISRSAIRYYKDKQLISSNTEESNGYSFYNWNDIQEMLDVAYFRNCMQLEAKDIKRITHSASPHDYMDNFEDNIAAFQEKIERDQMMLKMLCNFRDKIDRALEYFDRIDEMISDETFCIYYPITNKKGISVTSNLFYTSYWGKEYSINQGKLNYKQFAMLVDYDYLDYLERRSKDTVYVRNILKGRFMYTAFCSEHGLDEINLNDIFGNYIRESSIETNRAVYVFYLLTFYQNKKRYHMYEAYLACPDATL